MAQARRVHDDERTDGLAESLGGLARLWRRPEALAEPVSDDPEPPAEAVPPLRVLAADDHPTNRRLVEAMLGVIGVEVVSVEDGAQALAAFGGGGFDLVLMDLRMPVMDGLTAVAAIRALEAEEGRPRTPILILSAHALPEHQDAGRAAGADAHLAKPIAAAELYAAMEKALTAAA